MKRVWSGILVVVGWLLFSACGTPTIAPTPTPTRTPRPTPTLTPSPTPTPAFPVTVGCESGVPAAVCQVVEEAAAADPTHFAWSGEATADVVAGVGTRSEGQDLGAWAYAVAAPFFTLDDGTDSASLAAAWQGSPPEGFPPLVVTTDTMRTLSVLWGAPQGVTVVAAGELLTKTEQLQGWAIVPFEQLNPQWKVLRVDGASLLEKGAAAGNYPLVVPLHLRSESRPETPAMLNVPPQFNRDESQMTIVAMTGVTAMTRLTGVLMDTKGITYPAKDIAPWFSDADFVHISNEVSFRPDCVAQGHGTMSFCSNDRYIALLEAVHANIIELTGNHLADKGREWITHSLEMYAARGWRWFGGGADLAEATRPLTITHNGNKIAFLGCNPIGPTYDWATEDGPGSAPCDYERMYAQIKALRAQGYQPIVTQQYLETYEYFPTPQQVRDFRRLAQAGAVVVQGSQAHQAQTMEFYDGAFIHYGLGNFFFDQMWSDGTRQEFVDRLVFYRGHLLSVDLRTAILEEGGRPRPMTVGDADPAADKRTFLETIFAARP